MAEWSQPYGAYGTRLYVEATEESQNKTNNTTLVKVRVYVAGTNEWNSVPSSLTVTLNEEEIINESGFTYDFQGTVKSKEWKTVEIDVPHNPDGTGKAEIVAYATDNYAGDPAEATVTGTLTLTQIVTDKPLELSKTSFNLGETITIYPNVIPGEDMDIYLEIGPNKESYNIQQMATDPFDWEVPTELSQYFGSTQSINAAVVGNKFYGGFGAGTETVSVQINLPPDFGAEPIVGTVSMKELNVTIRDNIATMWVARRSRIEFSVIAEAQMGATLTEGTLHLKRGTASTTTHAMTLSSGVFSIIRDNLTSGAYQAWVMVKDNRGYVSQSETTNFTVVAYEPPKINSITANRNADDNTKINIIANVSNHHLNNTNTLTVKLFLKQAGDWVQIGDDQTTTSGALEYNHTATDADEMLSFNFKIEASDELTPAVSSEVNVGSGTAFPPINTWEDKALAIGTIYDEDLGGALQLGDDLFIEGQPLISITDTEPQIIKFPGGFKIIIVNVIAGQSFENQANALTFPEPFETRPTVNIMSNANATLTKRDVTTTDFVMVHSGLTPGGRNIQLLYIAVGK